MNKPLCDQPTHVIRPEAIDEVLVNPGMGIQTFQRFNGQAINVEKRWSEEGPTRSLADGPAADFPLSSIAYCRWFWMHLEPEKAKIRWDILDGAMEQARRHGQRLAIRLMPYDQRHPLPEWYRNSGARRANTATDKDGDVWQPDSADPLYAKHWGEFVAAAGTRYDGHPWLDTVDISSIGYWGEGWSPYMPSFEHQKALIDIYFDAFGRTPLLVNFDEEDALRYACGKGAGWRLDCWGDMRTDSTNPFFPNEMLDIYPQQIVRAGIQDIWQRHPVSLESCWVPLHWLEMGWDIDEILEQALRWHVSSVNIKSSAIPPEWRGKFDAFQKRMGYRLLLRRLEYPQLVRRDAMMPLRMWWLNAGVAPVYRPYTLAVQLHSPSSSAMLRTEVDVRRWLPGDAVFESTLYVPEHLAAGAYRFRVGLLDAQMNRPAIRLGIAGQQADGWYDLGPVDVV